MCNDEVMTALNSQENHKKLVRQNSYDFVISRCCFAEDSKEMYKDSKRTCRTIVLLITPSVSRFRRRRGLVKLPNNLRGL